MLSAELRERNQVEQRELSRLTTIRIGGPAEVVTLEDRRDLPELVAAGARWLGKGANLLVGDDGVDEPVVRLGEAFSAIEIDSLCGGRAVVHAGGAAELAKLVRICAEAGLAGPEGLAGVPASIGGALKMNAGTAHCWILDFARRVEVLLPGEPEPRWLGRAAVPAAYRCNGLPAGTVFLGVELELATGDPEALRARATELKQLKAASQPLALRSAGCSFKNPSPELPAGKLIDELGLKGARVGEAVVSERHANFIVNEGAARALDVARLVTRIRRRAWRKRQVALQLEVQTWNCPIELHLHPRELEGDDD
ncbi:MAG: FAD-binding protein [Planctomycetota bacterium]|jgi:UDP-N-acetylmuramate dehydrogenase|nr:FAD-binding protein [Planctomycetota bacterium]